MTNLSHRLRDTTKAIEDVLVAAHGVRHDLGAEHPPFWLVQGDLGTAEKEKASIAAALAHYGPGPQFNLWCMVRAAECLWVAWEGP